MGRLTVPQQEMAAATTAIKVEIKEEFPQQQQFDDYDDDELQFV